MEALPPSLVLEAIADLAIENERAVVIYDWKLTARGIEVDFGDDTTRPGGIVLMPDVIVLEFEANGTPGPETWTLHRGDGRSVHIYRTRPLTNREFRKLRAAHRRKGVRR